LTVKAFKEWCQMIRSGAREEPLVAMSRVIEAASDDHGIADSLHQMLSPPPHAAAKALVFSSTYSTGHHVKKLLRDGIGTNGELHFILLDLLMYEDRSLVTESLQLLMVGVDMT
jgi:hypothetical protein